MKERFSQLSFNNEYRISNLGCVQRFINQSWRNVPMHDLRGYKRCCICRNNKTTLWLVHRLVLTAFHGPPPTPRHEAMHLNNIKSDNRSSNLRWGLHWENMEMDRGRNHSHAGARNPNSKLTAEQVQVIRTAYDNKTGYFWGRKELSMGFKISEKQLTLIAQRKQGGWKHL